MKYTYIFLIFILSLINSNQVNADDSLILSLKEGGKIIFIRHALAPGNGDPENFNIYDCSTQRNLDQNGIRQSKRIATFFEKNKIEIDEVLSSEWCRCKDTAKIAFKNFETFDALNSFYDPRFEKNKSKQIKNLKKFINNWKSNKNLILVTHFVVISEMLGIGASSGEVVVSDKNLSIQGTLEINR